ncbi:MAG TPA: secretion protein HlyD, partial [Armatimonadetes bacterium]|nr:secretion protein HlyD [Armatimonadota bacterium]
MPIKARLAVLLVLLVGGGTWWLVSSRRAAAEQGVVQGSGTIEATEVGVAAQAAGRIARVLVEEGDQVQAGQVLAELDQELLAADHARAQAMVVAARNNLANLTRGSRSEDIRARSAALTEALAAQRGARRQAQVAREAIASPPDLRAAR